MQEKQAISALGALAQETRLGIFRLLVQRGPQGHAAGAIAASLGVPAATLSFHLQQLLHAGLIEQRRESRSLIYSVNFRAMQDLVTFLTENCCRVLAQPCAVRPDAPPLTWSGLTGSTDSRCAAAAQNDGQSAPHRFAGPADCVSPSRNGGIDSEPNDFHSPRRSEEMS